jgi:transposase-like protein
MMRGMDMLQNGATITELESGAFAVPSQTSSKKYEVRILGDRMVCTCPDFEYRQIEACKHIHLVKFALSVRQIHGEPKPRVFAEDAIPCDKCGSIRVIKFGFDSGKQTFYCKDCKHKFREPSMIKKAKFTPEFVTLTLDLYFSGLSLRKIARTIGTHFSIDVNYSTIYTWIQKYVPMIAEYVNSLSPELSKEWHADELFVKVRGGSEYKGNKHMGFLWNIMDRQTRYLIASKVSQLRDTSGAVAAFQEAAKNVHGNNPETVYTDSLRSYYQAIPNGVKHARNCGVGKPHETNNRIERLNGTLRERTKVQRGWKKLDSPLAEGQRIQYNFVKPHMALEGKTPAQVAGIDVRGWNRLLDMAVSDKKKRARQP